MRSNRCVSGVVRPAGRATSSKYSNSESRLLLPHMHGAGHERMHGADVLKVTFAGKRMLDIVVGIQTFRGKALVVARHGMRRLVVIGPDDLGAGRNRDVLRRERKLRN